MVVRLNYRQMPRQTYKRGEGYISHEISLHEIGAFSDTGEVIEKYDVEHYDKVKFQKTLLEAEKRVKDFLNQKADQRDKVVQEESLLKDKGYQ